MYQSERLAADVTVNHVYAAGKPIAEIVAEAREVMEHQRAVRVGSFPLEPDAYLEFLQAFGEPLANYSSRSDLDKTDPHPQINRVKYKRKADTTKHSVHYVAGGLRPHSARSWFAPRPRYFAMLMLDPGWLDTPPGERGESLMLEWQPMFAELAERDGETFEEHFERLSSTPLRFRANNVREELSELPLL